MPTAYAALEDRLLVCVDTTGSGWETSVRLEGYRLECVAVSPDAPERAFVGTFEDGLFRSSDAGDSFEPLETPFVSEAVTSLAISPHDPDVLYAGTEPSRVYRSEDAGDSWEPLEGIVDLPSAEEWFFPPRPHTHHVRWLEVDPFDPDRLYVGIEAGAFVYSDDGGETWQERPTGSRRDNHTLAVHPDRRGRVYTAAGDGYAESDDGGESWHHPQEGLEHTYCWGLAVDPGDPDSVIVSSASGARSAHSADTASSYVYRRSTAGSEDAAEASWERLADTGLPTGDGVVRALFDTTDEPGVVYAVNNQGLFVSEDFGGRWESLGLEWSEEYEEQTPRGLAVVDT
ncbi:WD40/YVTN/BNR-like repeat-containing protein [Natrarchaeobaculum sulfurireducens]|uniref:Sortilin N-terminal domain-containing protein n=1 Tax=Natrarchaeobaculum sulfurireducens TaxID=2044521 RepID=A0A346PTY0_9EURY|nr:sialidase family protein [Natrarchaeobaculum sulfurireducens]AXR77059.1 hypothetical protein AArc1_0716 [Natrarchaeobaculum sulfurireducens]AXR82975.1 hypothetical protein AArcMg_2987 [Natrarchaeobaculum sulfurireducens]